MYLKGLLKANRKLSTKEKDMILKAYQTGFADGYKVGSKNTTEIAKRHCDNSMEYIKSGKGLPPLNNYLDGLLVETSKKKQCQNLYGIKIDQSKFIWNKNRPSIY